MLAQLSLLPLVIVHTERTRFQNSMFIFRISSLRRFLRLDIGGHYKKS